MSDSKPDVVGDPRTTPVDELARIQVGRLGIQRTSRGDAIRAMCLACVGTALEVRLCECAACPLYGFRFRTDPWRDAREMTEEQKQAGAERLAKARAARLGKAEPEPIEAPRKLSAGLFDE
jgi:hypothetical protein